MLNMFVALAEPTRLRIVELLGDSPRSVGDICDSLALAQPQASKHLRVLRDSGLVEVEQRAQQRIYSLRPASLRELHRWLERYRSIWDERMDQLEMLVEELKTEETSRKKKGKP